MTVYLFLDDFLFFKKRSPPPTECNNPRSVSLGSKAEGVFIDDDFTAVGHSNRSPPQKAQIQYRRRTCTPSHLVCSFA